jgi:DNA polymerase elongation subunit (family B)
MRILEHLDKENIMLVNTVYHNGSKATEYKDHLDIIYKDLKTGEKKLATIETPEVEIYFAKEHAINNKFNRTFIEIENTEMHVCKYKDLAYYIAKQAGPDYVQFYHEKLKTRNRGAVQNLHKYKNVFGSDYDIENWYRIQWFLNNHNDKPKPLTKQYLDIEVDSIDIEGFPKDGDCPINAVTIVDEEDLVSYTFLLRNEKNPQIQEFEDTIEDFVKELHEAFDETYGDIEYKFYMYDDERDLIRDMFKLINTLKRDFILIWNMAFDIPFIVARIKELDMNPVDIMCHKDFPIKEQYYKKDTLNFKVENKSDFFKISSYTAYLDQMLLYAGLRKGGGELRSYALNAVAKKEVQDEKLDYSEDANIKTLPYVDYKKFVMYNIKDVLLQLGIERKTGDIDNVYQRAYTNATSYNKIFKQTVFLKNRAYIEYYKQGLIIGNNINLEYGIPRAEKEDDEEDEKFDGALVANPTLNDFTGIKLFGSKSMYIFDNVVDMDFSAMYPHIIIAFNIAPNCMIGKLIIGGEIQDAYKAAASKDGKVEDAGKDFMDNLLVGNVANMGSKWFGLPNVVELNAMLRKKFNMNTRKRVVLSEVDVKKYFAEPLIIDLGEVM